ncbi:isocitrate/isopropylmalate dehydrogenase family protein [Candidatus Woesearchaeota archaeon]|nr:isocitrate/isopropylmalate dehydrogenase family protein [Candidatus Woesearchaeota archaeon]
MRYKIAVFPGDGVGPELINEGIRIIDKAAELGKFDVEWARYPHGAEHLAETRETLNEKTLKEIKNSCNAIYCGTFDASAANANGIPSMIRDYFEQFAGLRPIKLFPNVESAISGKTHKDIDFAIIRESTEDFYIGAWGRAKSGKSRQKIDVEKCKARVCIDVESKGELAFQMGILSRKGCERIAKFAFEYAKRKNKRITAVDKSNMMESYSLWREAFEKTAKEYPGVEYEFNLIGMAVVNLIRQPEKYNVIVAPNMFGDILSDLGTVLQGGLSFGARANINPDGISMFEPIHGSAQKLKEKGIVNPIAAILAGALLLDSIGQQKAGELIVKAIESVLKEGRTRTQDLDGNNSTSEMGEAILDRFVELHD